MCGLVAFLFIARGQTPACAQPVMRFPQTSNAAYPSGTAAGVVSPTSTAPPVLGVPTFDPYATNPGAASIPPTWNSSPAPMGTTAGFGPSGVASPYGSGMPPAAATTAPFGVTSPTTPAYPGPPQAATFGTPPPATFGTTPGAAGPYGQPYTQPYGSYPPGAFPNGTPPALYPNGMTPNWAYPPTQALTPRLRYTWIIGGSGSQDLGINDFDASVAVAFPNFLYSSQPLYVIPSFSLHLWDGPESPQDLPANAYSAFLDFGWATDPARPVGGEIGVRLGAFSGFNTFTTYSWRIMGQGLFRVQTTPTMALRGGVIYLDRNKIKLLPAFGLLWTPNPETRFDIFFPHPKLAQRLTTMGNHDVWWYVGGEYGGGAWTVEREAGFSDRIDLNDIRLTLGAEWGQSALLQQGKRTGFVEIGWVTQRELIYVTTPGLSSGLSDSFMVRAGFNY